MAWWRSICAMAKRVREHTSLRAHAVFAMALRGGRKAANQLVLGVGQVLNLAATRFEVRARLQSLRLKNHYARVCAA